jgi:hypothetical protein
MGVNREEKQAVTGILIPLSKGGEKKRTLLDEFTRPTGCHRKSAIRLL